MAKAGRVGSKKAACCSWADAGQFLARVLFFTISSHFLVFLFDGSGPHFVSLLFFSLSDSNVVNCPPTFRPIVFLEHFFCSQFFLNWGAHSRSSKVVYFTHDLIRQIS